MPEPTSAARVAALYDIHGNLPALEAVLAEVRVEGIDRVVVGGDVVPGPMAAECLSLLLDLDLPVGFLSGNGEAAVLAAARGEDLVRVPEAHRDTIVWTADALTPDQRRALAAWPATVRLEVDGQGSVLFCHATPRSDDEIFTRLTPSEVLAPVLAAADADVVVCGHTHMQFDRSVGDIRVVNAGSVGMPFGEPGAYWLVVGPGIELRRTEYAYAATTASIRETDFPGAEDIDVERPRGEEEMLTLFESAALR